MLEVGAFYPFQGMKPQEQGMMKDPENTLLQDIRLIHLQVKLDYSIRALA